MYSVQVILCVFYVKPYSATGILFRPRNSHSSRRNQRI